MCDAYITGSTVVQHCVKAHMQSQWRKPKFDPPVKSEPLKFSLSNLFTNSPHQPTPVYFLPSGQCHALMFADIFYSQVRSMAVMSLFRSPVICVLMYADFRLLLVGKGIVFTQINLAILLRTCISHQHCRFMSVITVWCVVFSKHVNHGKRCSTLLRLSIHLVLLRTVFLHLAPFSLGHLIHTPQIPM